MIVASNGLSWDKGALARALAFGGKATFFVGMILFAFGIEGPYDFHAFVAWPLLLGPLAVAMSYAVWLTRTSLPGEIDVRGDHVVVRRGAGARVLTRRDIVSAYVVQRTIGGADYPTVEIETRRGSVLSARMRDARPAHALVDALGFGPGGKRVRIAMERPTRRLLNPFVGGLAYMLGSIVSTIIVGLLSEIAGQADGASFGAWFIAVMAVCVAVVYALLKRVFAAPVVEIGNDGVAVRRGFRTTRVHKNELEAISHRSFGMPVVLQRKNGRDIGVNAVLVDEARKQAIAAVADERLFRVTAAPDRAAAFDRAGRDVGGWRQNLRAALDGGYRAAGASVDDAAAVLASPAASSEQRIGAALALRVAGEPPERVRVAADGAVDPRLRAALEAIADDADDETVERRLRTIGRAENRR